MMTLEKIVASLQDRRLDIVAQATGVHPNTLRAIRQGKQTNPTYSVLKAINDYLENKE